MDIHFKILSTWLPWLKIFTTKCWEGKNWHNFLPLQYTLPLATWLCCSSHKEVESISPAPVQSRPCDLQKKWHFRIPSVTLKRLYLKELGEKPGWEAALNTRLQWTTIFFVNHKHPMPTWVTQDETSKINQSHELKPNR